MFNYLFDQRDEKILKANTEKIVFLSNQTLDLDNIKHGKFFW